jgi:hypothetical protein
VCGEKYLDMGAKTAAARLKLLCKTKRLPQGLLHKFDFCSFIEGYYGGEMAIFSAVEEILEIKKLQRTHLVGLIKMTSKLILFL